jgi:hypothetical protein
MKASPAMYLGMQLPPCPASGRLAPPHAQRRARGGRGQGSAPWRPSTASSARWSAATRSSRPPASGTSTRTTAASARGLARRAGPAARRITPRPPTPWRASARLSSRRRRRVRQRRRGAHLGLRAQRGALPDAALPWAATRAALEALAANQPGLEAVQVTYVNPETGRDMQNNLGFHARRRRARRGCCGCRRATVLAGLPPDRRRGGGGGARRPLHPAPRPTPAARPGYEAGDGFQPLGHRTRPFVFIADESPLHRRLLGVYEVRD